jgi:FKBP-type peptidyl-prolyl cis-trans isomerase FklB
MKTIVWTVMICLGTATMLFTGCKTNSSNNKILSGEKARVSYAFGMSMARALQRRGIEVEADLVARGAKDGLTGPTLLTPEQAQETLTAFQSEFFAKQKKIHDELAAKNQAEAKAFLATNKNNQGVVTLTNGLQYRVITNGTGATPAPEDTVTVNYRGTLMDGTEFDSSFKSGKPAQLPVTGIIPGWTEALLKMNVGSKWQVFIPPALAYGEQDRPGVPPNSLLIFEIDLLSTKSPPPLTSDIYKVPTPEEMKKGAKVEVIKPEDLQKMQKQQSP